MRPQIPDNLMRRRSRVPSDLIRYTCGHEDHAEYLRSGSEVATMLELALIKHFGRRVSDCSEVLDFGCGSGRIARFMQPAGHLSGCDVNGRAAAFCDRSIRGGTFHQNGLMPPLDFASGRFDLVYAFSVFSHLRQDVEETWLAELARVGAPGCAFLLTVQGDWMIEATLGEEADAVRELGFSYRAVHQRHGSPLDFPDYYESSYHTSSWVREHWAKHFVVLDVIKGDDPARYLSGDLAFAPQGTVPVLRPMGQDLVVAVKRP